MREKFRSELKAEERRGIRTVGCQVSSRYIKYGKSTPREQGFGYPVTMGVYHDNYGEKSDRKLCELIFSLEDLEVMVAQLKSDISKQN